MKISLIIPPNILPIILISNPHLLVHNTVMYTKQRCEMTLQDLKVDVKNVTFCIQQSQYSLKGMTEYISVAAKKAAQKLTMLIIPKWLHGLLVLSIILLCSAFRARISYPWMCWDCYIIYSVYKFVPIIGKGSSTIARY